LELEDGRCESGAVVEGVLLGAEGRRFPIRRGIPRFVLTEDEGQRQTERSFGYKWKQRETYGSPGMLEASRRWLVGRYGFGDAPEMRAYMAGKHRVLDAGCGSGFSASLWISPDWGGQCWVGADISEAIDVARDRLANVPNAHFVQADLLELPFPPESFDVVFSEGVLHHTPSTERAFKSLVPLLAPGGELMVYVYRRKGPIREFADDEVRRAISSLPPEEAWAALRPLTELARSLAELRAEVDVREDIPYLGIKAGRYDVQRLIYWHFLKLFWNEEYTFEENNHINFDWYHPRYAHRQTEEDVRRWCDESGLAVTGMDVQESGITVRAVKGV
jgi:SAM-dependent methyltransferase